MSFIKKMGRQLCGVLSFVIQLLVLLLVTKAACAMDLGNREWYHRSAGIKTTGGKSKKKEDKIVKEEEENINNKFKTN